MALLASGALHLGGLALLAGVATSQIAVATQPVADPLPERVWLDGPVVGGQARVDRSDDRRAGASKSTPAPVPDRATSQAAPPKARARQSRKLDAPNSGSEVAVPSGTHLAAVELEPALATDVAGSEGEGEGPIPMGSGDGYGPPQAFNWGAGGWESDYGRSLANRIEDEARDAELGPRPLRLKKSLVVVLELDRDGNLIRQKDGSLIRVVKSRVTTTAEKSLLAAVKRASEDFPPFPVQGAKDRFTLEVRFRLGPDGLSVRR